MSLSYLTRRPSPARRPADVACPDFTNRLGCGPARLPSRATQWRKSRISRFTSYTTTWAGLLTTAPVDRRGWTPPPCASPHRCLPLAIRQPRRLVPAQSGDSSQARSGMAASTATPSRSSSRRPVLRPLQPPGPSRSTVSSISNGGGPRRPGERVISASAPSRSPFRSCSARRRGSTSG